MDGKSITAESSGEDKKTVFYEHTISTAILQELRGFCGVHCSTSVPCSAIHDE